MGRLARIHLRSKGKGQELRKNLSVSLKHIKKIVKERKRVDRLGRALSVVKKAEEREKRLEIKMHRKKRKEYQVTQLAKPGRSSAAKKREASKKCLKKKASRNTVKAVDKVLSQDKEHTTPSEPKQLLNQKQSGKPSTIKYHHQY